MEINKILNTSANGRYAVSITADYNDGDYITSYNEYDEPDYFEKNVAPLLKELLDNAIGHQALENYLYSNPMGMDPYKFCDEVGIVNLDFVGVGDLPHTIECADAIKIIYFAPNGASYNVIIY